VTLREIGHGDGNWQLQPTATERLLTSFYAIGVADNSLYSASPVDFRVSPGFPALAKPLPGPMALLIVLLVPLVHSSMNPASLAGGQLQVVTFICFRLRPFRQWSVSPYERSPQPDQKEIQHADRQQGADDHARRAGEAHTRRQQCFRLLFSQPAGIVLRSVGEGIVLWDGYLNQLRLQVTRTTSRRRVRVAPGRPRLGASRCPSASMVR
jgi:hypothetical protein